jgi:hypothetical protein
LGGKIPRNIKVKVIRQWLDGLTRERIAKKEDIGAGTNCYHTGSQKRRRI